MKAMPPDVECVVTIRITLLGMVHLLKGNARRMFVDVIDEVSRALAFPEVPR